MKDGDGGEASANIARVAASVGYSRAPARVGDVWLDYRPRGRYTVAHAPAVCDTQATPP